MSEVLYKYTGAGHVVGLPARDIRDDEKEYHELVETNMRNSSLPCWVKVEKPAAKVVKAKDSE